MGQIFFEIVAKGIALSPFLCHNPKYVSSAEYEEMLCGGLQALSEGYSDGVE
jgi:hypothetical protein